MLTLPSSRRQAGISLLEALIALVVATLGVLGVLGMQMRTLADNQTGVRRAQAIRLTEDLSERTRVNPNSLGQMNAYVSGWGKPPASSANCNDGTCTPSELAAFNMAQWKASVAQLLPAGDASVFIAEDEAATSAGNRRQLGVMISWRENEHSSDASYRDPIGVDGDGKRGAGAATCPAKRTCHLQYIPLSARCAPYFADAAVQFFCTGQ